MSPTVRQDRSQQPHAGTTARAWPGTAGVSRPQQPATPMNNRHSSLPASRQPADGHSVNLSATSAAPGSPVADAPDTAVEVRSPAPPPSAPVHGSRMIEFGHLTHVGLRRDLNEDTYYGDSDLGLWLVADEIGRASCRERG